ncbi:hypothetical protein BDQ17DRAFT_1253084 [Cyathus striatus]|nr:hypothetical protein BDQ17DRAFT_1253084 [Cyathus striatus]
MRIANRTEHTRHISGGIGATSRTTFKTIFSSDAKIWELYLNGAERVAKERAERWKTWLDSILIFAGLFAGVVGSFVNAATSGSQSDIGPTSATSVAIKGLWFCSLIITIFGAVMGVLAKTWISNYIPVSNRREAEDAYRRVILDKQAERWHLERIILVIPLLVQMASFLFAIGFAIRAYSSHRSLGILVTIIIGVVVVTYVFTSICAAAMPYSFPFHTPPSDLFIYLKDYFAGSYREEAENKLYKYSEDEELAEVWRDKLIMSSNILDVKEGFLELNRQWTNFAERSGEITFVSPASYGFSWKLLETIYHLALTMEPCMKI